MGDLITDIFNSIFSEAFAMGFLAGLVLFLLGLGLCGLVAFTRIRGRRVKGKIIGAVEEIRFKHKIRDGEEIKKEKRSLFPVYEYIRPDGTLFQERGSEGGTNTLKYKTGQDVNLLVIEAGGYDDVYDADDYGAAKLGLVLMAIGGFIMFQVGSVYSAMGMGGLALFGAVCFIMFRVVAEKLHSAGQKPGQPKKKREKYKKTFDRDAIKPVEVFVKKRESERAEAEKSR